MGTVIGAYSEYRKFNLIGSGGFGNVYQYKDQMAVKEEFKVHTHFAPTVYMH